MLFRSYEVKNGKIYLFEKPIANAVTQQAKKITGVVVDSKGEPIIGANVVEKGTQNGTITDFDGKFILEVSDNATLQFSYIGFMPTTVAIAGQTSEIKDLYNEKVAYWQSLYSPLIGEAQDVVYNLFLKGNKIPAGTANYSEVIALLIALEGE